MDNGQEHGELYFGTSASLRRALIGASAEKLSPEEMNVFHYAAFFLLVLFLFDQCCSSSAAPSNSMTRIQEVFRTLMGSKPAMASRGKKFYSEPLWVARRGAFEPEIW
ncbi:hypothetical protein QR680_017748 [Steinernema hermaphroditum]|uniref:Uncharacterized protein n=1 Tax=Steinernema hermaphroditum TaxID=289476 RepID=A0AA39HHV5_9BILA|nr:hypothetical protein QR680_017748 [Steinernema hermaphroditum]